MTSRVFGKSSWMKTFMFILLLIIDILKYFPIFFLFLFFFSNVLLKKKTCRDNFPLENLLNISTDIHNQT